MRTHIKTVVTINTSSDVRDIKNELDSTNDFIVHVKQKLLLYGAFKPESLEDLDKLHIDMNEWLDELEESIRKDLKLRLALEGIEEFGEEEEV